MVESRRPQPAIVRRRVISELVADGRFQRTQDLAEHLGVSTVTVRADLEELEAQGLVRRTHGGAVGPENAVESDFEVTRGEEPDTKARIARACVRLIRPGDVVMLDAGTTTTAIATLLAATRIEGVTVVTNNLMAVFELHRATHLRLMVTGGTFRLQQHSLVDPLGDLILDRVRADIAFVGCNGITADQGVTNANFAEADVKVRMLRKAGTRVLAADSRKVGQLHPAVVCMPQDLDHFVTDLAAAPAAATAALVREGLHIIDVDTEDDAESSQS
ncbi:DeoR/GlpR family DNA-binding transcription regulator [Microbacterium sp. NPDC091313]